MSKAGSKKPTHAWPPASSPKIADSIDVGKAPPATQRPSRDANDCQYCCHYRKNKCVAFMLLIILTTLGPVTIVQTTYHWSN